MVLFATGQAGIQCLDPMAHLTLSIICQHGDPAYAEHSRHHPNWYAFVTHRQFTTACLMLLIVCKLSWTELWECTAQHPCVQDQGKVQVCPGHDFTAPHVYSSRSLTLTPVLRLSGTQTAAQLGLLPMWPDPYLLPAWQAQLH